MANERGNNAMAHHSSIIAKTWKDSGHIVMPLNALVPPQYSAPPPPLPTSSSTLYHHQHTITYQQYQQQYPSSPSYGIESNSGHDGVNISTHHMPDTHKSMWAINPLYASNSGKFFLLH